MLDGISKAATQQPSVSSMSRLVACRVSREMSSYEVSAANEASRCVKEGVVIRSRSLLTERELITDIAQAI
uniref:Uncharacterized protein n=1 Tax=Burkholderia cenocepacia TaxID=95486 RepID=A0A071MGP5_9BURK